MSKQRTITLTGRRPVIIDEAEWPVIAQAAGDSYRGLDGALHMQAISQGDVDQYSLRVRRHADGRAVVYGTYDEAWPGPRHDGLDRAGEVVAAGDSVEAAIERVGTTLGVPAQLIADAIASLPAEQI
jgi:hypothetical protein